MTTITVDKEREKDAEVMADFLDTTVYHGPVGSWEDHLSETEKSDDEPEE
jgi:hypothetical protein